MEHVVTSRRSLFHTERPWLPSATTRRPNSLIAARSARSNALSMTRRCYDRCWSTCHARECNAMIALVLQRARANPSCRCSAPCCMCRLLVRHRAFVWPRAFVAALVDVAGSQLAVPTARPLSLPWALSHSIVVVVLSRDEIWCPPPLAPARCPDLPLFHNQLIRRCLTRVLYIWAMRHPASGYVQVRDCHAMCWDSVVRIGVEFDSDLPFVGVASGFRGWHTAAVVADVASLCVGKSVQILVHRRGLTIC